MNFVHVLSNIIFQASISLDKENQILLILRYNEMQCLSMYEVCVSPISISKLFYWRATELKVHVHVYLEKILDLTKFSWNWKATSELIFLLNLLSCFNECFWCVFLSSLHLFVFFKFQWNFWQLQCLMEMLYIW